MKSYEATIDRMEAVNREAKLCNLSQTVRPFDISIEVLLIGLLVFMPLAFGAVHAWSEEVVIVLSGAITICFVLKLLCYREQAIIWTWAYVPLAAFLLVAIFQLIPLPRSLVEAISPNTAALKAELLGDLPNAQTLLQSITLSFYPYATRHDLRLILAVAVVFIVVLNVYRRGEQIKRLLMAITLIGGTIAIITLGQNLFGNGKIYWFVPTRYGGGLSGPFVNHNNYGQFMNLSIGAALALLLVKLHEGFAGKKITPTVISDYLSTHSAKSLWLLVAVIAVCVATVFVSLTRGGMVSFLTAMTTTILVLAWQKSLKGRGWIMAAMALMAFTFILYVSFDAVYDRLASLRNFHEAQGSRLQILSDIFIAFRKFPIFGTGLGTHLVVYPMFDRSMETALAAHAENEYAQALEETGLVGLAILIIFGIIIWVNFGRCIRKSGPAICSASYGLGFGLLAILIHSLSDFGQHLPANAVLSTIFCALLLILARLGQNKIHEIKIAAVRSRAVCSFILVGVCSLWTGNIIAADRARIAEAHWQKARDIEDFIRKNGQATDAEYADLISYARQAADYEPDNIKYQHWLNVYRWRCVSQTIDLTAADIVIPDNLTATVCDIVEGFHKARTICPTYGPTYSLVGQIEMFILHRDVGAERIRKGFRLAPCHPTACFVAGYLNVLQGQYEEAIEKLNRAIQLDGRLFDDVVNIYINQLSRPHLAILAAGDDIGRLQYVTNVLEDMHYIDLAEQSREKIKELLIARSQQQDAPAWVFVSLADIYKKQQDSDSAIECLRRALALDYGQVDWRLELARLLKQAGRVPQAMRQARICLRLRPQSKAAQMLVADLSVHPDVLADEKIVP